jgi:hypothetical protein
MHIFSDTNVLNYLYNGCITLVKEKRRKSLTRKPTFWRANNINQINLAAID